MKSNFDLFEKDLMDRLLYGNDETLNILRRQYNMSSTQREFSGSGFFTNFQLPDDCPTLPNEKSFQFGDVVCEINNVEHGVGFVLFVKSGKLNMLEGYTYEGEWPSDIENYKLSYMSGNERNLEELKKKWQ